METQFNVLTMLFKRIKWHYLEEQLLHIRQSTAASFLKVFFPITSWWLLSELFLHFLCTFPAIPWNDLQLAILHLTHTRTLQMQSSGGCESQKAKVKKIVREWFWPEKWKWEWIWPQRCCRQNFEQPDRILRTTSWWFSWFVCFLLPLTAAPGPGPGRVWFLNWLDSCDCINNPLSFSWKRHMTSHWRQHDMLSRRLSCESEHLNWPEAVQL